MGASGNHGGGQMPFRHQCLRAIDIGQQHLQQIRPLDQPLGDPPPFLGADEQRHGAKRPFALILVANEAEGEAQFLNLSGDLLLNGAVYPVRQVQQACGNLRPLIRHTALRIGKQVAARGCGGIAAEHITGARLRVARPGRFVSTDHLVNDHPVRAGRRRSSVMGNSPGSSSGGMATVPGVWP